MARNSKGRRSHGKKTVPKVKNNNLQKKVVGMEYVEESDNDSSYTNPKEGDLITPKSAMIDIQHQSKYNFTEWLDSLKHPITLLNTEQGMQEVLEHKKSTSAEENLDEIAQITVEDIQPEIDYWQTSIVAYVLGANPPGGVMDGFFRRVWKDQGVDKVIAIKKGMFLVRLNSIEVRDKLMNTDKIFFDHKPDDICKIPIWVQLDLHFKYWGFHCIDKIIKPLGKLCKLDENTMQRNKLQYARCMVEVNINQQYPPSVHFMNERKEKIEVGITYEWKPEVCAQCKKMGHSGQECHARVKQQKQQWIKKSKQPNTFNEDEGKKQIEHKTQQPQQENGAVREGHMSQLNIERIETREGNANQEV
ncbi:hypothetical protein RDABS01_036098 [Bienertia sinuspersici]